MKRILSLVLTFAMVFTTFGPSVYATGEGIADIINDDTAVLEQVEQTEETEHAEQPTEEITVDETTEEAVVEEVPAEPEISSTDKLLMEILEELKKIEEFFNIKVINEDSTSNCEIINVDYYTDVFASCGNGNIIFSEERIKLPIATMLIEGFSKQKKYSMINATGNSMSPTIDNGDKLIVEHWNGEQIQDNKVYVFCFNNEFFVKRLSKNLDEIIIKSDNPDYRVRTINGNTLQELILVGKIVGVIKALG